MKSSHSAGLFMKTRSFPRVYSKEEHTALLTRKGVLSCGACHRKPPSIAIEVAINLEFSIRMYQNPPPAKVDVRSLARRRMKVPNLPNRAEFQPDSPYRCTHPLPEMHIGIFSILLWRAFQRYFVGFPRESRGNPMKDPWKSGTWQCVPSDSRGA